MGHTEALPSDIVLVRHGEPVRGQAVDIPADDGSLNWVRPLLEVDRSQPLKDIGRSQARAAGRHIKEALPRVRYCISSDYPRAAQTAEELLMAYDERFRPELILDRLPRERWRGLDHPVLLSKAKFEAQFPEIARMRATNPSDWHPRYGETRRTVGEKRLMTIVRWLGAIAPNSASIISTSGEVCISSFGVPELGNMTDQQIVEGFGEGMPATTYEYTARTYYTRRDPDHDMSFEPETFRPTFDHMRVVSPHPEAPHDVAWDTGWLAINR